MTEWLLVNALLPVRKNLKKMQVDKNLLKNERLLRFGDVPSHPMLVVILLNQWGWNA
jgi:hypothetical protein